MDQKSVFIYIGVFVIFFLVIAAVTIFLKHNALQETKLQEKEAESILNTEPIAPQKGNSPEIPTDNIKKPVVTYRTSGFSSSVVMVEEHDSDGCFITIQNESPRELLIRLSPHTEADNWGSQYPPIEPGGELIIDPRYRITSVAFHNHKNPKEEFMVNFGAGCRQLVE